ncbi:MAG TPA: hypothetical protein VFU21_14395 [Kofleriaceae bacterium]|nr:hypothetical protein [Kofleriaceae bacterium]
MAIRIERSGARTVVVQRRRPVRLAAWVLVVLGTVGLALAMFESREAEELRERDRTRVRCQRAAGSCEVQRGSSSWLMRIETLSGARLETDGVGADARVMAILTRRHGLQTQHLCEARAGQPEAAGVRAAAEQLALFITDRQLDAVDVACETARQTATGGGSVAGRLAAQVGGTLFILLAVLLFLVEVTTEIDPQAGVVRVRGRRALPPRRWSIERPIAEVRAVETDTAGWGGARSFTVFLRFTDGSTALVLSPVTGRRQKVVDWQGELSKALGVPPSRPAS